MYVEYIREEITPIQGRNHTYPLVTTRRLCARPLVFVFPIGDPIGASMTTHWLPLPP